MIEFGLIVVAVIGFISLLFFSYKNKIGPTPSSKQVSLTLIHHLPQIEGPIVDLGAGWGNLIIPLAKKFSQNKIIGFENSWIPYLFLKLRTYHIENICIIRKDFWKQELEEAFFVCYLYKDAMDPLKQKLQHHKNINLVTHTFAVTGWQAKKIIYADDLYKTPIFYYSNH